MQYPRSETRNRASPQWYFGSCRSPNRYHHHQWGHAQLIVGVLYVVFNESPEFNFGLVVHPVKSDASSFDFLFFENQFSGFVFRNNSADQMHGVLMIFRKDFNALRPVFGFETVVDIVKGEPSVTDVFDFVPAGGIAKRNIGPVSKFISSSSSDFKGEDAFDQCIHS
jgi:hypothetical protein